MKDIIGNYEAFILNVSHGLGEVGINRSELAMMDHLCYRVETQQRYQELQEELSDRAKLLGEALISGRKISTFELDEYLEVDGWTVPYIELPEPKSGSHYSEGLEHAELVVIGGLERFISNHSDIDFNHKGMGKTLNPELGLKTELISVKFHEQQLGSVVAIENRLAQS